MPRSGHAEIKGVGPFQRCSASARILVAYSFSSSGQSARVREAMRVPFANSLEWLASQSQQARSTACKALRASYTVQACTSPSQLPPGGQSVSGQCQMACTPSPNRATGLVQRSRARAAWPNPSLKLTRYGKRCKPGLRHLVHHRSPGLQRLPPRAP